jgi:hypothetical protein
VTLLTGDGTPNAAKLMNEEGMHRLFKLLSCSHGMLNAFQPPSEAVKQLFIISQNKSLLISVFSADSAVSHGRPSDISLAKDETTPAHHTRSRVLLREPSSFALMKVRKDCGRTTPNCDRKRSEVQAHF